MITGFDWRSDQALKVKPVSGKREDFFPSDACAEIDARMKNR